MAFTVWLQPRQIIREWAVSGTGFPSTNPRMTNLSDPMGGGLASIGAIPAGVRFHLEVSPQSLERLIFSCRSEIDGSPYVQDPAVMLADPTRFTAANKAMDRLLEELNHP